MIPLPFVLIPPAAPVFAAPAVPGALPLVATSPQTNYSTTRRVTRVIFPSAIELIRTINNNTVDNLLGGRDAFLTLPSLYQLAYSTVYETGELPLNENILAPDESVNKTYTVRIV